MLTLLLGGVRSGKSAFAVRLAREQSMPVTFIATARAADADMAARIDRHRQERPPQWETVEAPTELLAELAAAPEEACVVIDCLTVWTANVMSHGDVVETATAVAELAGERCGHTIAVSNEVGMGVHPTTALGRDYRDLLGRVNQEWARRADEALLLVAGRALVLS